jgi:sugar lactone lactonase YvrE
VCELDVIELPGDAFYPEGIASAADGTLYVGSLATGAIVRVTPCETDVETFVDVGTTTRNVVGMIVDEDAALLWACDSDFSFMTPPVLQAYDLASGALVASHDFGAVGFCNDIALGVDGAVYATDSSGARVVRVAPADRLQDTPVETWLTDPEFVVGMGEFGLNGIALADDTTLYAVNYQQGELYRIPIEAGGTAGAVTLLDLDVTLVTPDGLKALAPDRLLVVEQGLGGLSSIDIAGDAATVTVSTSGLDFPTTFAIVEQDAWVSLGQLDHLLGIDPAPPTVPFTIVRVALPM